MKERWDKQVEDVIEFYAAWAEIGTGEGAYKAARQKVARLLAARKNLRDFLPHEGEFGIQKSSLDGLRESVFRDGKGPEIAGLRLKEGEVLDSVALYFQLYLLNHYKLVQFFVDFFILQLY